MRRALLAVSLLVACDAASSDPGTEAYLQIAGAQYAPGLPPAAGDGPGVLGVLTLHNRISPGDARERLRATLDRDARAVAIWLEGDLGHWILPAGPPEADAPDRASLDVRVGFAADLPPGPLRVQVQALDADGVAGEPGFADYVADPVPVPEGTLVFSLGWAGVADLDLHVIDPDGIEIWSGNPNSYEPPAPGEPPAPPDAWKDGGLLDLDANQGCIGGGQPREHIVWTVPPPVGRYVARVDTRAMCGAALADWHVAAYRDGEAIAAAEGKSTVSDTAFEHGANAGVTALELELPEE